MMNVNEKYKERLYYGGDCKPEDFGESHERYKKYLRDEITD
jgi:hypothetical protein